MEVCVIVVLVLSCDKNEDLWYPFHYCIEKYWKNHPEVIYKSETKENPYYPTLLANYPLEIWSKGIRECLEKIKDDRVLLMVDDIFIREPVNEKRLQYVLDNFRGACINFEKAFPGDIETELDGIKMKPKGCPFEVSIMCGLWDRKSLIKVLSENYDPWSIEIRNNGYGMDFYINSGEDIINWGYTFGKWFGIQKGKWCKEALNFFRKEGVDIDYEKRGFI